MTGDLGGDSGICLDTCCFGEELYSPTVPVNAVGLASIGRKPALHVGAISELTVSQIVAQVAIVSARNISVPRSLLPWFSRHPKSHPAQITAIEWILMPHNGNCKQSTRKNS